MATLITGGTGFIAAEIARLLVSRGETDLTVFDIDDSTHRLDEIAGKVKRIRGDVGNFSHVLDAVRDTSPEVIYHLAGLLSLGCEADPHSSIRVNALGTYHVLEAARLFGVEKVIFSSSIGTYGTGITTAAMDDLTLQRPCSCTGPASSSASISGSSTGASTASTTAACAIPPWPVPASGRSA